MGWIADLGMVLCLVVIAALVVNRAYHRKKRASLLALLDIVEARLFASPTGLDLDALKVIREAFHEAIMDLLKREERWLAGIGFVGGLDLTLFVVATFAGG